MNEYQNVTHTHIHQDQKYKLILEQAASAKGVKGWKIEANGDNIGELVNAMEQLKAEAERMTEPPPVAPVTVKPDATKGE